MKAVCWAGVGDVRVETVPDATVLNARDAILRVRATTICGSDLHLYNGYIPFMQHGDILGHEFMGEVVDIGPEITNVSVGDRVVVPANISCGSCFYCRDEKWSCCDNTNPNAWIAEELWGHSPSGIYGYSHALGGYAGSHAEFVRVPYADVNTRRLPDSISDEQALFLSDAWPTAYTGVEFCEIAPGDTVAVWGCGAVGIFCIVTAYLAGAERVIAIDRLPERLELARRCGAETVDFTGTDVVEELKQMTGGRGPDACIEAVGMEAHTDGLLGYYDRVKQATRLESERLQPVRQAVLACRKGGIVAILGVFGGFADKFPLGAVMNKGLTLRSAQLFGHRYLDRMLDHVQRGDVDPAVVATHRMTLEQAPDGYELFKHKRDGCIRVVLTP